MHPEAPQGKGADTGAVGGAAECQHRPSGKDRDRQARLFVGHPLDFASFFNASLDYLVLGKVSDSEVRARLDAIIQTLEDLRRDM